MPMHNLIEFSDNYSKTSRILWQYYWDEPDSTAMTNSESSKSKARITESNPAAGNTKNVVIAVALKYLCNFWRTLKMPLINYEINLILTWTADCVISVATPATKFVITDIELYISVIFLPTQDNGKLLPEL